MTALIAHWSEFASIATESKHSVAHVARIIAFAPERRLTEQPYADGEVSAYFSLNAADVLNEGVEIDLSRLKLLQVEVADLPSIAAFPEVIRFLSDETLYQVSIENIQFVFEHVLGWTDLCDLETKHFTTVLKTENKPLITCIEQDFIRYVSHVLLRMERNTEEDVSAVLEALNHKEVATEYLEEFLVKQSAIFPSLEKVPHWYHPALLQHQKIENSWENCLAFLSSESYSAELLTEYLQDADPFKSLSANPIPDGDEAYKLREFVIKNDGFAQNFYRAYVQQLPRQFEEFPTEPSSEKLEILIEEEKIVFSDQTFEFLEEHDDLQVLFIAHNIVAYLNEPDSYPVDDDIRTKLLKSDITDNQKRTIIRDIDPVSVSGDVPRAAIIGPVLNRTEIEADAFDFEFIRAIIVNSSPAAVQISLFNKCHHVLEFEEVRKVIEGLPTPFSEIAIYGKSPKIENTPENWTFVAWLKERKVISSSKITFSQRDIRIYTFKKWA